MFNKLAKCQKVERIPLSKAAQTWTSLQEIVSLERVLALSPEKDT